MEECSNKGSKRFGVPQEITPYSLGAMIGFLYCGILLVKEQWFDLLPEDNIENSNSDWGFLSATFYSPKKPTPTIKTGNAELLYSCKRASGDVHIDPDHAPTVIIEKLWKRLRESHRLRVVK